MRYLWRGLGLAALGGLSWGAWFLASHPTWGEAPARSSQPAMTARARSMTISGWQQHGAKAEKLWQVTAHEVGQSADGRGQTFDLISEGTLYRDGRAEARFSAGKGQSDLAQGILNISQGARVRLEADGTALATEEVHWQGPQRQLWLPRPIHLTRGNLSLNGGNAHLDLRLGRLTAEYVSGTNRPLSFQARHAALLLKERRLELYPVVLQMPPGQGHAKRVIFLADEGRFQAQEVQMKLLIPSVARAAAATGLTLALLNASAAAPAPEKKLQEIQVQGHQLSNSEREMEIVNAEITHKDTKVTADRMVFEKDAKNQVERIIATGKPRAWNERNEVTGARMIVYPKERRVVVEENVRVVVRPKPGETPPSKDGDLRGQVRDGVMTGDRLEYDYRNKNIAAAGHLKLISRGRTATGERLFYTDKTEEVEFFGPVHARDEKGQTFDTGTGLKLALGKGGISHVPGKFTATLYVEEEEEPAAAPASGEKTQKASTPPTTSVPTAPNATNKQASSEKKAP